VRSVSVLVVKAALPCVEMMVSLFIFAIVSTMFTVSIVPIFAFHHSRCYPHQIGYGNSYIGARLWTDMFAMPEVWKRLPAVTG